MDRIVRLKEKELQEEKLAPELMASGLNTQPSPRFRVNSIMLKNPQSWSLFSSQHKQTTRSKHVRDKTEKTQSTFLNG
jgi:hypothetical protein